MILTPFSPTISLHCQPSSHFPPYCFLLPSTAPPPFLIHPFPSPLLYIPNGYGKRFHHNHLTDLIEGNLVILLVKISNSSPLLPLLPPYPPFHLPSLPPSPPFRLKPPSTATLSPPSLLPLPPLFSSFLHPPSFP